MICLTRQLVVINYTTFCIFVCLHTAVEVIEETCVCSFFNGTMLVSKNIIIDIKKAGCSSFLRMVQYDERKKVVQIS
jgi:hypothetical protein